jgi:hypothetical protein
MSDLEPLHRRAWLRQASLALLTGPALGLQARSAVAAETAQAVPMRDAPGYPPAAPASDILPRITPEAVPSSLHLRYRVRGSFAFVPLFADGDLIWRRWDSRYDARLRLDAGWLGARERASAGAITATGLQPLRYTDRARYDRDTEFDWLRAEARLGRGGTTTLTPGTQDLVSLYIQLACLFAAHATTPRLSTPGTPLPLPVLGNGKSVEHWRILVQGEETLDLPGGQLYTRKLLRLPEASDKLGAELWLAPALSWMPARIRLREEGSSDIDLRWSQTLPSAPPPASQDPARS